MNDKTDVLNLEWISSQSRDREIVALVANYLRMQGLNVFEGSIFNGYNLIDTLKPKLVYISNSVGALYNLDIIRYAKSKGIPCITGMSEGNFNKEGIAQFVWGVNKRRVLYEDECYLWNKKSLDLALNSFPELKGKFGVCGAIGFDRYIISNKYNSNWLSIDKNQYKQVVGIGCWNFDFTIKGSSTYRKFNGLDIDDQVLTRFKSDRDKFNIELIQLIENNPQVLFLIKLHPGCQGGDVASGVAGVRNYENVVVGTHEFSVMHAISVSDVWLTYESTTAVEAWLMGVPTGLLNPTGTTFPFREGFHLGQPNFPSASEWGEVLKEQRTSGKINKFDELSSIRNKIILEIINWSDGLNHVRMGNAIIDMLELGLNRSPRVKLTREEKVRRIKRKIMWAIRFFLPLLPSKVVGDYIKYASWDCSSVRNLSEERLEQQKTFYKESDLSLKDLRNIKAKLSANN